MIRRRLLKAALLSTSLPAVAQNNSLHEEPPAEIFDVVIAGAGAAGLTAAVMAQKASAGRILVLEKEPLIGGTSVLCEGNWSASCTSIQADLGIKDTDDAFFQDIMRAGDDKSDPDVVWALIRSGRTALEWLVSQGVTPYTVSVNSGLSVRRAHCFLPFEVINFLRRRAESLGVSIRTGSEVTKLIRAETSEKGIWGIEVKQAGKTWKIQARRAVILATGGFGRNREMVARYAPKLLNAPCLTAPGSTGDGIRMAAEVGANLRDMDNLHAAYAFLSHPESINAMTHIFYGGAVAVNKLGRRFVDESLDYTTIASKAIEQPDAATFLVFDERVRLQQMKSRAVDRLIFSPIDKGLSVHGLASAETLKDAAAAAGLPVEDFITEIEKYNNEISALGREASFGRSSLFFGIGKVIPLEVPPFYILSVVPAFLGTYCGIAISPKAEALDANGRPIPRLYAAGEVIGGLHGRGSIGGTHYAAAFAFGRLAGIEAAAQPRRNTNFGLKGGI